MERKLQVRRLFGRLTGKSNTDRTFEMMSDTPTNVRKHATSNDPCARC